MTPPRSRWLLTEPDDRAPLRLFCFAHAGAGGSVYRLWQPALQASGVQVCPVQLPGREDRFGEPPFASLSRLTEALSAELAGHAHRPFALFGHSLGALVAFELARTWSRTGASQPVHVAVSGRMAPHLPDPRGQLHRLSDGDLLMKLRRLGGMPADVAGNTDLMALHLPLLRADLAMNETYGHRPGAPLDVPITAFGGRADPKVRPAELAAWGAHTRSRFAVRMLPGGHFYLQAELPRLLRHLLADLHPALPSAPARAA